MAALLTPNRTATPEANPPRKLTWEEFLDWCDEDTRAEWNNGEIILMTSPASIQHQDVSSWLSAVLRFFIEARDLGRILAAPIQMRLSKAPKSREPDLIFIGKANLSRVHDTFVDSPVDLVVEILSPESIARDRGEKFIEYESEGIPEYWLFDPLRKRAEFYQLDDENRYQQIAVASDGIYRSRVVPGFWLKVNWLWQSPLPRLVEVLKELGVG